MFRCTRWLITAHTGEKGDKWPCRLYGEISRKNGIHIGWALDNCVSDCCEAMELLPINHKTINNGQVCDPKR